MQQSRRVWRQTLPFIALAVFVVCFTYVNIQLAAQESVSKSSPNSVSHQIIREEKTSTELHPPNAVNHQAAGCAPKKNVFFLKTHKCASSSMQNILMRYGFSRNQTFVLPRFGNYFGYPHPFREWMALPMDEYNIFCHHSRLSLPHVKSIMPSDASYVSIMRNPVDLFESLYSYYNLQEFYFMDIDHFAKLDDRQKDIFPRAFDKLGKNQIAFDFGMETWEMNDELAIQKLIQLIDTNFHLIMIAEFFDESLILLKELMCWNMEDIIYFSKNRRLPMQRQKLSEEASSRLDAWNGADRRIYDYFYQKFKEKVKQFGENRMRDEVALLKKMKDEWYNTCIEGVTSAKGMYRVEAFQLRENSTACRLLVLDELSFTELLRQRHIKQQETVFHRFVKNVIAAFQEIGGTSNL